MELVRGDALYRQLANAIRSDIQSGEYPPGSLLPSESALCERYGVSRPTVRQALAALRTEGLIIVQRGKGSFVRAAAGAPAVTLERAITRSAGRYVDPETEWSQVESPTVYRATTDATTGPLLGLDEGEAVFGCDRLMTHQPTGTRALLRTVIPFATAAGADLGNDPMRPQAELYAVLEAAGHRLTWHERVSARVPAPDEAAVLRLPEGVPVMVIRRVTGGNDGPLLLEETRISAEATQADYVITPQGRATARRSRAGTTG
ncbi:GntR family transcriptional regulator [Streptomyces sp. SID3343]|uniref:GntR family transcriptional regulator n=1 Tax=Streptomyces sp. SID3343 TaxID=2690260 RepID=UPI0013693924|nr:GntR family transcriptional regulator [Streptomyces sp. SID3343]MYV99252.1 GntR family transcriptional regulator [Streptomyces sp. SID3343]